MATDQRTALPVTRRTSDVSRAALGSGVGAAPAAEFQAIEMEFVNDPTFPSSATRGEQISGAVKLLNRGSTGNYALEIRIGGVKVLSHGGFLAGNGAHRTDFLAAIPAKVSTGDVNIVFRVGTLGFESGGDIVEVKDVQDSRQQSISLSGAGGGGGDGGQLPGGISQRTAAAAGVGFAAGVVATIATQPGGPLPSG